MRKPFEPKVSIVTGGASGIGKAIAAELVARGSHVVLADLDLAGAEATARELGPWCSAVATSRSAPGISGLARGATSSDSESSAGGVASASGASSRSLTSGTGPRRSTSTCAA